MNGISGAHPLMSKVFANAAVSAVAPIKLPAVSVITIPEKITGIETSRTVATEESKDHTAIGNHKARG
jgi:hypothetical protein